MSFSAVCEVVIWCFLGLRMSFSAGYEVVPWEEARKEVRKNRWPTVCFCGFPPIEQKALDGWGTVSSLPVGIAGRRLT